MLWVKQIPNPQQFGVVVTDDQGNITEFVEKPEEFVSDMAIIGIIPNLVAAGTVLGVMGLLGIPLDLMTITIAAITIGIAVDDTIHYIHRFQVDDRRQGAGSAGTAAECLTSAVGAAGIGFGHSIAGAGVGIRHFAVDQIGHMRRTGGAALPHT